MIYTLDDLDRYIQWLTFVCRYRYVRKLLYLYNSDPYLSK